MAANIQTKELVYGQTKPFYFATAEVKIDASSLFTVVQDVLNHTIFAAEKHFLGKQEKIGRIGSNRVSSSCCPLRVLKQIACKVGCNASTVEEIRNSVINLLRDNSWAERAVLTLAAFAVAYGEILFYVDSREHSGFASSISSLMRVDVLIGHCQDHSFQLAFDELNKLTSIIMEMIPHIIEFEKLSNHEYIRKDPSAVRIVQETMDIISQHSERVIHSLIDCILQVNYLNDKRIQRVGLLGWINLQQEQLKELEKWHEKIEELKAYWEILSCIQDAKGITQLIMRLMYSSNGGQYFYDCHSKQQVNIEVLKGKKVLLFISGLDICDYDFSALLEVHKALENHEDYKIVWIPIVEQWDIISTQKFTNIIEKMKWYAVCYQKPIIGIRYIKREWHFCYNPMVVVFDSDGRRVHENVMHMIRLCPKEAFPFNLQTEACLISRTDWISQVFSYYLELYLQVKKESYIIFYGGKDKWIETFRPQVEELVSVVSKPQFPVASFAIQNIYRQGDNNVGAGQFWDIIESIFNLKVQWACVDAAVKEIQKLYSYRKYQDGWALVYHMGSSPSLFSVSGAVIVDAVAAFLAQGPSTQLGFWDQLHNCIAVIPPPTICCHIDILSSSGSLPVEMECPFCPAKLKRVVTYVCCHNEIKQNGSS